MQELELVLPQDILVCQKQLGLYREWVNSMLFTSLACFILQHFFLYI